MIDINNILIQALTAAVAEATKPLVERIAALETKLALETTLMQGDTLSPDDLVQVKQRIEALENIAAEYSPTASINEARLVEVLDQQEWFWEKLMRKAAEAAESAVEEAINDHCNSYDHDDYDNVACAVNDANLDDMVTMDNLRDEIKQVLRDATVSIDV